MKILLSLLLILFVLYPSAGQQHRIHLYVKPEPYINMTSEEKYDPVRIVNAIMSLQETYPEGSPWTTDDYYYWFNVTELCGYDRLQARACAAFAMLASDTAFGPPHITPVRKFDDISEIRIGDILKIDNNRHEVIVIEDMQEIYGEGYFKVVEGNYASTVHYGRIINVFRDGFVSGYTRYPPDYLK